MQNTMAHGVARLSPKFSRDRMRWLSLGQTEAGVWQRNLFDVPHPQYLYVKPDSAPSSAQEAEWPMNAKLRWLGVPGAACSQLLNPGTQQL